MVSPGRQKDRKADSYWIVNLIYFGNTVSCGDAKHGRNLELRDAERDILGRRRIKRGR
jgi:hypothetical protein